MKKHNFSAGPSILSNEVFDKASKSILNFDGISLSILEISHRSKEFVNVMRDARKIALHLLDLDEDEYAYDANTCNSSSRARSSIAAFAFKCQV